ncbi:MAG: PepSY-associated TM helix domain-containing protein [Pseudomonadota bacterium]
MTRQRFFTLVRSVHLYSSTALFASLAFFCVTGVTLSHGWYLDSGNRSDSRELAVPELLVKGLAPDDWNPDIDALTKFIERSAGLREPTKIELDRDYGEITLSYSAPAADADVLVTQEGMLIDAQRGSWLATLNDLHKNRDAGLSWSILIDVTAIGMLAFALTGLVILFQNRRQVRRSLMIVAVGLATPVLVFLFLVPRIPVHA